MASSSNGATGMTTATSSIESSPSVTQLLFARAVILTMDLWPAMRLAIAEQWGGEESSDKRDFLISHICDTYSDERTSPSSTNAASVVIAAPATPDLDDLADTMQMYFDDEFESRLEDGSTDWVAGRIVNLHKIIYAEFPPTQQSIDVAQAEVTKLYEATVQLRGQKFSVERTLAPQGSGGESCSEDEDDDDDGEGHGHAHDAMQVDQAETSSSTQRQRQEPMVDEDGFTTVVKGRRRP